MSSRVSHAAVGCLLLISLSLSLCCCESIECKCHRMILPFHLSSFFSLLSSLADGIKAFLVDCQIVLWIDTARVSDELYSPRLNPRQVKSDVCWEEEKRRRSAQGRNGGCHICNFGDRGSNEQSVPNSKSLWKGTQKKRENDGKR